MSSIKRAPTLSNDAGRERFSASVGQTGTRLRASPERDTILPYFLAHFSMRRYLFITAAVVSTVLVLGWLQRSSEPVAAPAERSPTPVVVAKVRIVTLYDRVEALGTAFANESVNITANVTETITSLHFEDGQAVKRGAIIATLAQAEEQAQLAAMLEQLDEHQRELRRLGRLLETQAEARRAYDERKTLVAITRQRIKEITARIEDRTIRAPFDGVLGLRTVSVGALVEPGDVITTIDDINQIKLDFTVPATFLSVLRVGSPVRASSGALDGKVFVGTVATIAPRVDPETRSVVVRALLGNPQGELKPGMLMQVTLRKNERRALVIPEEALVSLQRRNFVLVVDPDNGSTVQRKQVAIGGRRPGEVEILGSLGEGELVIVRGTTRVRPGDPVKINDIWDSSRRQAGNGPPKT